MADSSSTTHTAQSQNEYLLIQKSYLLGLLPTSLHSSPRAKCITDHSGHCAGTIETSIRSIILPSKHYRRCPRRKGPGSLPLEGMFNVRQSAFPSLATAVMTAPVVADCTSCVHQTTPSDEYNNSMVSTPLVTFSSAFAPCSLVREADLASHAWRFTRRFTFTS